MGKDPQISIFEYSSDSAKYSINVDNENNSEIKVIETLEKVQNIGKSSKDWQ